MPDFMDAVQEQQLRDIDAALARHQARPAATGRSHCERSDCGEPVGEARMRQGARLCIECAEEERKRSAHFAAWSRR